MQAMTSEPHFDFDRGDTRASDAHTTDIAVDYVHLFIFDQA